MKVFSPPAYFFFSCVCILCLSAYAIDVTKSLREPRVKVIETGDILIDKLYPSMTGSYERVQVDTSDETVNAMAAMYIFYRLLEG